MIEILVNVGTRETRAALTEERIVQEIFIERCSRLRRVSSLYKGRVTRVLPGMQAAFVDIGAERTAFLHAADIVSPSPVDTDLEPPRRQQAKAGASAMPGGVPERVNGWPAASTVSALRPPEDICRLVSPGDELLVQVIKDPIGSKGARLTTFVTLPARFLVYMPRGEGIGVSAKIEDEAERMRLKALVTALREAEHVRRSGGYILRTAAQGVSAESLRQDMTYLDKLWQHVERRTAEAPPGSLVHEDLPLSLRLLRDELSRGVSRVVVDSADELERMAAFAAEFMPEAAARLELHTGSRPIFDLHGIEDEICRALERKVMLRCGGHLIIDQTEAMTTIDVNTGGYVGHRNLEETSFRTNLEAADAIGRQLRLRNLGGIIIIDFIDMARPRNRQQVLEALDKELDTDRTKTYIVELSPLGLVEMTRQNVTEGLRDILTKTCPTCGGEGVIVSEETMAIDIERRLRRLAATSPSDAFLVEVHPKVAAMLIGQGGAKLRELEEETRKYFSFEGLDTIPIDTFEVTAEGSREAIQRASLPVAEGDEVRLRIEEAHMYNPADAIAKIDGYVVSISGASKMVGEDKKIRIGSVTRTCAYGTVVDEEKPADKDEGQNEPSAIDVPKRPWRRK